MPAASARCAMRFSINYNRGSKPPGAGRSLEVRTSFIARGKSFAPNRFGAFIKPGLAVGRSDSPCVRKRLIGPSFGRLIGPSVTTRFSRQRWCCSRPLVLQARRVNLPLLVITCRIGTAHRAFWTPHQPDLSFRRAILLRMKATAVSPSGRPEVLTASIAFAKAGTV